MITLVIIMTHYDYDREKDQYPKTLLGNKEKRLGIHRPPERVFGSDRTRPDRLIQRADQIFGTWIPKKDKYFGMKKIKNISLIDIIIHSARASHISINLLQVQFY